MRVVHEAGAAAHASSRADIPLRVFSNDNLDDSTNAVPFYDLAGAAEMLSASHVAETPPEWVELPDAFRAGANLFVARVVGESMNRRIPNGALCLFRGNPSAPGQNRVVLVQHEGIGDPELGGRFTLKVYGSEMMAAREGGRSKRIILSPDSTESRFKPVVLDESNEDAVRVLAELVAVIC